MRQIEFVRELAQELDAESIEVSPQILTKVLDKMQAMIVAKLTEGETVNLRIGQFAPWMLLKKEDEIEWVNGEGVLAHVENLNRDRVIPKFTWNDEYRRYITKFTPTDGEVGERIRERTKTRVKEYFRSKNFKQRQWAKAKMG